jgi:hypothetical protein
MRKLPGGCTRVPWGFRETTNGLVAETTVQERNSRAELGEFAIALLGKLGVSEAFLRELTKEEDPVAVIGRRQGG